MEFVAAEKPICSAKGCRADAAWVVVWNNPRIHTPDRRKTWLACDEHREHLAGFLSVRGFLKEVVALADFDFDATDAPGSPGPAGSSGPGPAA